MSTRSVSPNTVIGCQINRITETGAGDVQTARDSFDKLFDQFYGELRGLARCRLGWHARCVFLDSTTLVHESYLRLKATSAPDFVNPAHFLGYVAQIMRSIIVDVARRRCAERRGGGAPDLGLDALDNSSGGEGDDKTVCIREALAQLDVSLIQIVELRYFAGLTDREMADALGINERTVRRRLEKARRLLAVQLGAN